MFGGGSGDQLFAAGTQDQALHAGSGNVTLSGAFSSGADTFFGGSGANQMVSGLGNDTFVAGTGSATITAGPGHDLFLFIKGAAGGTSLIENFTSGPDTVGLQGYGGGEIARVLKTQENVAGSTTIKLSDNTTITFAGVTKLTASDFS